MTLKVKNDIICYDEIIIGKSKQTLLIRVGFSVFAYDIVGFHVTRLVKGRVTVTYIQRGNELQ